MVRTVGSRLWGIFVIALSVFGGLPSAQMAFAWSVPDTGQTGCYDAQGRSITCPDPGQPFSGQDGNYTINPPSYTKLDASGNALPESATSWVMVKDNVTGLIWEMKTDSDGTKNYNNPHDADNTYTWYFSDPEINLGYAGTPGNGTDTEDFVNALNAAGFGEYGDWRLPTRKELLSIVNYGWNNPKINANYFPNTKAFTYWTAVTNVSKIDHAWRITFATGNTDGSYEIGKSYSWYVRAVRGGQ